MVETQKLRPLRSHPEPLEFHKKFAPHPHASADPLYALPTELVTCILEEVPDWLTEAEQDFERDLEHLCARHPAPSDSDRDGQWVLRPPN